MATGANTRFENNSNTPMNADNLNSLAMGGNVFVNSGGGLSIDITAFKMRKLDASADDLSYAGGSGLSVDDSKTNYVYYIPSTTTMTTNAASFPDFSANQDFVPLATVTASGGVITAIADARAPFVYD